MISEIYILGCSQTIQNRQTIIHNVCFIWKFFAARNILFVLWGKFIIKCGKIFIVLHSGWKTLDLGWKYFFGEFSLKMGRAINHDDDCWRWNFHAFYIWNWQHFWVWNTSQNSYIIYSVVNLMKAKGHPSKNPTRLIAAFYLDQSNSAKKRDLICEYLHSRYWFSSSQKI
jgi:hypothetical protein